MTFTQATITEIPTEFEKYDFIELSNILSYRKEIFEKNIEYKASKLILDIYANNLKKSGTMLYQTRGEDPLSPLFTPPHLKRKKKNFAESDGWLCVYGLQKGGRK